MRSWCTALVRVRDEILAGDRTLAVKPGVCPERAEDIDVFGKWFACLHNC